MFRTRAPFGIVHAQEEDVGPAAVRQVEPDGRALDQDREERLVRLALEEPRDGSGSDARRPAPTRNIQRLPWQLRTDRRT